MTDHQTWKTWTTSEDLMGALRIINKWLEHHSERFVWSKIALSASQKTLKGRPTDIHDLREHIRGMYEAEMPRLLASFDEIADSPRVCDVRIQEDHTDYYLLVRLTDGTEEGMGMVSLEDHAPEVLVSRIQGECYPQALEIAGEVGVASVPA